MQWRRFVSAVWLILAVTPGMWAQTRGTGGNALDQGNDACPAAVIPMAPYYIEGTTVGMSNDYSSTCGGSYAPDVIYEYTPAQTDYYSVSLCGTNWDTVLYLREGGVCPGDSQVVCNDDYCGLASTVWAWLYAGHTYYIIVDGWGSGSAGFYRLHIVPYPACDIGSFHNFPVEVSEFPIDSVFYEHDPNGECGSDSLPAQPYYSSVVYLLGRSFNYYDDTGDRRADEDWYSFGMMEPDTVTVVLRAYFPIHLEMLKLVDECDSMNTLGELELTTCSADSIVCPCAAPGDYALHVTCAADTEMLIPQFYLLSLHRSSVVCQCDTCECDSVTDLTVFPSPDDQHVWLHWSADSAGEVFTIYSTAEMNSPVNPSNWHSRAVYAAAQPGWQCWTDPEPAANRQRYIVVRYCP